jgi:uncharacterized repeat protein (TIGR03803 family)
VFQLTTAGAETVTYNFAGFGDGAEPVADLLNVKGVLYGTTQLGPVIGNNKYDPGIIFKVTPYGIEIVLHEFFKNPPDGAEPVAGLTYLNNALYGTTSFGGNSSGVDGTIFKISL